MKLIEMVELREVNGLLTRLREARDARAAVLDSTHVLVTSNLGNASSHSWRGLPVILAGGGFQHGRHVVAGGSGFDNARFCNLFVQIARRMGVDTERFGSSDGSSVKGLS